MMYSSKYFYGDYAWPDAMDKLVRRGVVLIKQFSCTGRYLVQDVNGNLWVLDPPDYQRTNVVEIVSL